MLGSGFRIGRLYGINIRVDWSWLFILLLITWNLAVVFEQLHASWGTGLSWGIALLAALLFFISVLAHELAHSLVARSQGLPVRNITLFLFGGVSNIQREPSTPKDEFWMAIVGPLTSLVIGIILLLLSAGSISNARNAATARGIVGNLTPLNTILLWLGSINIILAIFNLVPGFPLDGGRVLRSILWGATNNLRVATRWAAWIGQGIAWILIVTGIAMAFGFQVPFFGTGLISGLWLAFIGWFLNSASAQSYQQVEINSILEGVPVSRLMRQNPPTVEPDCTITDLVHTHMMGTDDQSFPVINQGRLDGIITLDDVRKVPRDHWDTTRVAEAMTPSAELVTVAPNEESSEAMNKLVQKDVRQLPVVTGQSGPNPGEFVGLLRRRDIMRWLQLHSSTVGRGETP